MMIRSEEVGDEEAIHAVHVAAFPADEEARLVSALRAAGRLSISLVAVEDGVIVGHVAFSPVTVDGVPGGLGLAPVAVLPSHQRHGIGGKLVQAGLTAAAQAGVSFVVVLGHPEYYPRFGFRVAGPLGLNNEYGATDAFMVAELQPGTLPPSGGLVRYCQEFAAWS